VIVDQLEQIWQALLDLTAQFVMPDWGVLVGVIPVALVVLVVGPLLTLLALYWLVYLVRKPRTRARFVDGPTPAPRGDDGLPLFPSGEPYSSSSGLVYAPGTVRADDGEKLMVICPMCGLGRLAEIDTCGNCGLVLKVIPRARGAPPAGPPPGGAAIA
jgi:hypothetical protein